MSQTSNSPIRVLSRHWNGHLATYRQHQSDEHREALLSEALRYAGFRLESSLGQSEFWGQAPLLRRAAVLLYLVDRGVVSRVLQDGRYVYEARADAESWVTEEPALAPYVQPTLELIAALRSEQSVRRTATDSAA